MPQKFKLTNLYRIIPQISLSLLGITMLALIFPTYTVNLHATNLFPRTIITPSISVAMTEPDAIDLTPQTKHASKPRFLAITLPLLLAHADKLPKSPP